MLLSTGAEAEISKQKNTVVKIRKKKAYRHEHIDAQLRKQRTRREARILEKLASMSFPAPRLFAVDEKKGVIEMTFLEGTVLKDVLEEKATVYGQAIGTLLTRLHEQDLIHGDLTTSNMILAKKLHFIDFGLSFTSQRIEDKAVDLHLLRQALESKHPHCWKRCFNAALSSYTVKNRAEILKRLDVVEKRGRNKH